MRVLFDYQALVDQKYGGVSRQHCEVTAWLRQFGVQCDTPVLYSQNEYYHEKFGVPMVEKYIPKTHRIIQFVNNINTLKWCRKNDYDVIHPTWYDPYLLDATWIKGRRAITIHDMIYELYPERFSSRSINDRGRYMRESELIIAVSNNTKKDILRFYPDIDEGKIRVVYPGNTAIKSVDKIKNLPEKYLLYVGNRSAVYKNFIPFLNSIKSILNNDKSLNLVCVGGGLLTEKEKSEIKINGLDGRVMQFTLTDPQVNYAYQNALCCIYPSKYEGFGLPILEAMANSCPCITSRSSSLPEVGGDAVLYFDPDNEKDMNEKIYEVVASEKIRHELVVRGNDRYKFFSWEKTAKGYFSAYREVLGITS